MSTFGILCGAKWKFKTNAESPNVLGPFECPATFQYDPYNGNVYHLLPCIHIKTFYALLWNRFGTEGKKQIYGTDAMANYVANSAWPGMFTDSALSHHYKKKAKITHIHHIFGAEVPQCEFTLQYWTISLHWTFFFPTFTGNMVPHVCGARPYTLYA